MNTATHYVWRKLSSAKWEDAWLERLSAFSDRVAITSFAGKKSIRVEAFQLTRVQAQELAKTFGGEAAVQKREMALQSAARPPIRVREKLIVVGSASERADLASQHPHRQIVLIPAGMAFGTGDHATTATCLRLLADVSAEYGPRSWEMIDLGCGTAILAIAARLLGATRVEAGDFDPAAVRVSKENVRLNGVNQLRVSKLDVRQWLPARTWDVVVANMFSGVLIEAASKIAAATAPGGRLIFSGILRLQEAEVIAAFEAQGFRMDQVVRKGKWITGAATKPR